MHAGSAMPTREECGVESVGVPGGAVRFGPASKRIVLENYAGRDRTLSCRVDPHPRGGWPSAEWPPPDHIVRRKNKTDPIITSMVISYANTACGTLPKLASSRRRGLAVPRHHSDF
jgi:hypothetical protein